MRRRGRFLQVFVGVASLMEYKQFHLRACEREPGKWRAKIRRADGKPMAVAGQKKIEHIVTSHDAATSAAAISMAIGLIDTASFKRNKVAGEKFWRRRARFRGRVQSTVKSGAIQGAGRTMRVWRRLVELA
jgi:hypothetical protein